MSSPDHILVVDDDPGIRSLLGEYLERNGFRVTAVGDGRAMRAALGRAHVDLIVLDLMLPGEDGLELCRELRASSSIPVIMLTARGEETDRIVGLEMGADDYLPKPFNPRELIARIKGVLRRARMVPGESPALREVHRVEFAGWVLDLDARHLRSPEGVVVALSGAEFRLLQVLVERPRRVLTRDQLMDLTQGREHYPLDRSIDVQISRLRRKLGDAGREPRLIKTVRGAGYVLAADVRPLD